MDKINPLLYITDTDPVPEEVFDASGWFETEYITFQMRWTYNNNSSWGPDGDKLAWFMAQGWVIYNKSIVDVGGPGDVYEYTYYLKRRKLQSERVLQDMISEFTGAYNEGRAINDQRYDEIVNLYSVMLDKTEGEISALNLDTDDYEDLVGLLTTDFDDFDGSSAGMLDGYGQSQRDRITLQFDNEQSVVKQGLISRGMYNSTVWSSVNTGVERRRAESLNDLEDKILARRAELLESAYDRKVKVRVAVLQARDRIFSLRRENKLGPLELRNTVLSAMLGFMERRSDEYPGLDQLAGIAAQLGYGEGGTVAP